ncbi:transcriptional regulator [Brevibacillus centrosporus]|uniref:transcriptional regulator n=1 Tax=Brevibacillus centrosporus TaxID=54910 RepID=UPI002E1A5CF2|nr:transcriptional regulator [Brevibacillus centrosporus]
MGEKWKKARSKLGEYLDTHRISQAYIIGETSLGKNTLTRLCTKGKEISKATPSTRKLIFEAIKKKKPDAKPSDLWEDM